MSDYYAVIELSIRACKSGGIDTKVHGLDILGRVDMSDEEMAASFSFLTVDDMTSSTDQTSTSNSSTSINKRSTTPLYSDSHGSKVFVWGLNDVSQLGPGPTDAKVKLPLENRVLSKLHPMLFTGGSKCTFIVSHDGKVFACGEGANGKLGLGGFSNVPSPEQILSLSMYVVRRVATSTTGRHVMALTADGKVFSWGDGEYGQLGHGTNQSYDRPKMIEYFHGKHIKDIACGSGHSAAVSVNGELFTWGQGTNGRLGHGDSNNLNKPKAVKGLEKVRVTCVACSSREAHTLAAGDNNTLWSWGDGSFGKLGVKDKEYSDVPLLINTFSSPVIQIECGMHFSVALTKDGKVYTWGKGLYYRLGNESVASQLLPAVVDGLVGKHVIQISVGALHTLALTSNGEVYSWGDNEHGQLGNGGTTSNKKPQILSTLRGQRIFKISCGSSHSIAFAQGAPSTAIKFSAISFANSKDPLGSAALNGKTSESPKELYDTKRPSLTKIITSLKMNSKRQEALGHVLTTLQIAYARDTIVNALSSVVGSTPTASGSTGSAGGTGSSSNDIELTAGVPIVSGEHKEWNEQQELTSLDEYTTLLTVEDARVLVDLLKLAVSGRVGEKGKETLSVILTAIGKANSEVSSMLMELCISELEDVTREPQLLNSSHPVVEESPHPYPDNIKLGRTVNIPGAEALVISFDSLCSTERRHDVLTIKDGGGAVIAVRSGRDSMDWSHDVRVIGDTLIWSFESDGSVNGWGFRFTIQPIMPEKPFNEAQLSDRILQSRPSIDLVTCLLDFQLDASPSEESIGRLGAALASCAQLNILDANQRTWAIQQLRKLLNSPMGTVLITGAIAPEDDPKQSCDALSSLYALFRGLPDALLEQYKYELSHVTSGNQLLHSTFFQSLAGLACDLELDTLECCSDVTKWAWFIQYCSAARMAKSLQNRTRIPHKFLNEVNEKIESLGGPGDVINRSHEDHMIFHQEHDEELLLWMQRYPKDWSMPTGSNFCVFGWGHNHRGQLGGVEGNKIKSPRLCESLSELCPVMIAGGEQTLFAITDDGKVYASGYAAHGRLGIGGTDNVATPTPLASLATRGIAIKKLAIHSGGKHCLAVTTQGELYSWGEGEDGKLGLGSTINVELPHLVEAMKSKCVVDASCGSSHSACITEDGSLYTWGKGRYGRLGHNDHETHLKPKQVVSLKGEHVTCVACGSGDAQTLCTTSSGCVYSWGDGDYGKLGRGGNEGSKVPKKIESLSGKGVIKLLCGSQFSMALTSQGHVYTWGKGDYYRLGHGDDSHQRTPRRVLGLLANEKVIDIGCGSLHCIVCTESGRVFAWGDNDEGQIGNDTTQAVSVPKRIIIADNVSIDHVACGSAHSIAWSSRQRNLACPLPSKVPMEFSRLQHIPMIALRNRLMLLQHFSNLFCKSISLFNLHNSTIQEFGYDRLRQIIFSSAKESAFRRVVKATMSQGKQHGPVIELNRLQVKRSRCKGSGLAGPDGAMSVFGQMCSKWSVLGPEDLLLPHRVWKVKFIGESVDDCGGGYSESIAEMCDELQNGSVPLLIQTPNGREDTGVNRDCFIINPQAILPIHLNMFKFFGVLLGIAIRSGAPVNLLLAPPMWKRISGQPLSLEDLSEIDADYVQGLVFIRENPEAFVGIEFSTPSSSGTDISLHPSKSHVTLSNYQEYVRLAIHMRLHEFDEQISMIREGMSHIIPVPLLHVFSGQEIDTMVCGSHDIPIDLLKSVTTYKGIEPLAPLVRWFWEVMESFSRDERSLFLRFVWGRTRLPRTTADFRGRDFVLQVLDKYYPPDYYLPESYTCFFLLKLPRYSCKPVLEEKLRYAIYFCKSIDTDDYARVNLQEDTLLDDVED
jgi:E3 ubiquitin-protein ligase HERC2